MADQPSSRRRIQFRLRTLLIVTAVVAVASWGIAKRVREFEKSKIVDSELVGQPLEAILSRYGNPDVDAAEYRSLGPTIIQDIPAFHPIRTLIFHQSNGDLWVWLSNAGGQWRCFRSTWIGSNVMI